MSLVVAGVGGVGAHTRTCAGVRPAMAPPGEGALPSALPDLSSGALFGVAGKHCLVTGGGRGIGLMVAAGLVANGASVYIVSRTAKVCDAVAAALSARGPGTCVSLGGADLSTDAACVELASRLKQHTGRLHVLVNNSGTSWGEPMDKFPDKAWSKVFDLNVKAVFNLTRACLPLLRAAGSHADPARVVNVGSVAGIRPQAWPTYSYDVSKAAVHHLTTKLAGELAGERVTVNALAPGLVPSKMSDQLAAYASKDQIAASVPLGRVGSAEDMAGAVLYFAGRAGAWTSGVTLVVDGGALAGVSSIKAKL